MNYHGGGEKGVIVEVAPHHGNAFSGELNNVKPRIAYIPRCDEHTRWSISTSYGQSAVTRANIAVKSQHENCLILTTH